MRLSDNIDLLDVCEIGREPNLRRPDGVEGYWFEFIQQGTRQRRGECGSASASKASAFQARPQVLWATGISKFVGCCSIVPDKIGFPGDEVGLPCREPPTCMEDALLRPGTLCPSKALKREDELACYCHD